MDDADALGSVDVAAWRETYRDLMPAKYLASLSEAAQAATWRARLSDTNEQTRTVVTEREARIVGFCTVGPARHVVPPGVGEIRAIYLLAAAQRQGLGRRLLSAGAAILRQQGFGGATLWVARDNIGAIHFYEKLGGVKGAECVIEVGGVGICHEEYRWNNVTGLIG